MNKIKVVLLCHYSSSELRSHLPLSSNRLHNLILKLVGKKRWDYSDFASWNIDAMADFEKRNDIELHVIMPHLGLKKRTFEYTHNGVCYHIYRPQSLFLLNYLGRYFLKNEAKRYQRARRIVQKWIAAIKPDGHITVITIWFMSMDSLAAHTIM